MNVLAAAHHVLQSSVLRSSCSIRGEMHTADHAAEHHCAEPNSSEVDAVTSSGLFDMTPRCSRDLAGAPRLHKRPARSRRIR